MKSRAPQNWFHAIFTRPASTLLKQALPYSLKRWIKRVIYKQPMAPSLHSPTWKLSSQIKPVTTSRYDVLYFSNIDWSYRYQRPQHICSNFSRKRHRVFYISLTFSGRPKGYMLKSPRDFHIYIRAVGECIYEVQLPGPKNLNPYQQGMDTHLQRILISALHQLRQEQCIQNAICLVALPFWRPLAMNLKNTLSWKLIYDCMDLYSGFSNYGKSVLHEEKPLVANSDLVITTSKKLYELNRQKARNCCLIPNAVDFEHFNLKNTDPSHALKQLPKPLIGYIGAIESWFDTDLVAKLAKARPTWSFVLVGLASKGRLWLFRNYPNVHHIGEIPYSELPYYVRSFDVCMIPFKQTDLTEAINPVKFYEYLSVGKPIVSTPLPDIAEFESKGYVYFASTLDEFDNQIERALNENVAVLSQKRIEFAQRNTWDRRLIPLLKTIEAL